MLVDREYAFVNADAILGCRGRGAAGLVVKVLDKGALTAGDAWPAYKILVVIAELLLRLLCAKAFFKHPNAAACVCTRVCD